MSGAMVAAALEYAGMGWRVFPAPAGTKKSHLAGKHSNGRRWGATTTERVIRRVWRRWRDANIGIACGPESGLFGIDIDTDVEHATDGHAYWHGLLAEHGPIPDTIEANSPTGGLHVYFAWPAGGGIQNSLIAPGIDVRGEGGMMLAPPSVRPKGGAYTWRNPPPLFDLADAPDWLLTLCRKAPRPKPPPRPAAAWPDAARAEAAEGLSFVDPDLAYGDWLAILMALHAAFGDAGLGLAEDWSAGGAKYQPGEVAAKWSSFNGGGGATINTVFHHARAAGCDLAALKRKHNPEPPRPRIGQQQRRPDDGTAAGEDDMPKDQQASSAGTYHGDAGATEYGPHVTAVAKLLNARGLAFQFAGRAAVVCPAESAVFRDPADPRRPAMTTQVVQAIPDNLRRLVEQVSSWSRYDARLKSDVAKPAPWWVMAQLIGERGAGLAPLAGVADHPVFYGGKLLSGHIGYHRQTRLYLDCSPCESEPWASPEAALHFLAEIWLKPFPFRTDYDRLRALFLPLTLLTRRTLIRGGAPLVFITAPEKLTGKTLLATCLALPVIGREPPTLPYPGRGEELGKVFFAALTEGGSSVFFDNVPNGWRVSSPHLDRYATNDTYGDRILGQTENRSVPALATVIFTGNNIEAAGDTATRAYEIRLERESGSDEALRGVLDFTRANRSRILSAMAAVLSVEPAPVRETRFGDWETVVARPVMALAGARDLLADMVTACQAAGAGDDELADVLIRMSEMSSGALTPAQMMADDVCHAALAALVGGGAERLEAKHLSKKLRRFRDKAAAGFRLRESSVWSNSLSKYAKAWRAEPLE